MYQLGKIFIADFPDCSEDSTAQTRESETDVQNLLKEKFFVGKLGLQPEAKISQIDMAKAQTLSPNVAIKIYGFVYIVSLIEKCCFCEKYSNQNRA